MLRAFIAITPPAALQHALEDVRADFQQLPVAFLWVQLSHLHLTLKFLGNVPAEDIAAITQAMEHAVTGQTPFRLFARALGCFPNPARPRILWMGLDDPEGTLLRLHQRVEAALVERGFAPEERAFRPHLTLARIHQAPHGQQFRSLLHTYHDRRFGDLPVDALHLFQSQLRQEGAMYTILRSATFHAPKAHDHG